MAKLRNANDDVGAFTQWVGRKCRNHHPLEELADTAKQRSSKGRFYQASRKADVKLIADERNGVVYREGGRAFVITIEEVPAETLAGKLLIEVGS